MSCGKRQAVAERFQSWETSAITVWLRFDVNIDGMLIFQHRSDALYVHPDSVWTKRPRHYQRQGNRSFFHSH